MNESLLLAARLIFALIALCIGWSAISTLLGDIKARRREHTDHWTPKDDRAVELWTKGRR